VKTTIESYKSRAGRIDVSELDFGAFERDPLDPEALRCLTYMHDVELNTVCYLRELLMTSAHRDPEVTWFLSCWVWEEMWHGDAIGRVLLAHGIPAGPERVRDRLTRRRRRDAFQLAKEALYSALIGEDFVAIHMAWGAINEWSAQAAYARLMQRADHPVLSELLRQIMRQEGRHADFYASQATSRLAARRRTRRLTRFTVQRFWETVGSDIMPPAEVAFVVDYLFSGAEGRSMAERIDRRVDRLPGLEGLGLAERTVDRHLARPGSLGSSSEVASATGSYSAGAAGSESPSSWSSIDRAAVRPASMAGSDRLKSK
jgi:hypothetical protein